MISKKTISAIFASIALAIGLCTAIIPNASVSASTGSSSTDTDTSVLYSDTETITSSAMFARTAEVLNTYKVVTSEATGKKSAYVSETTTNITYVTSFTYKTELILEEEYSYSGLPSSALKAAAKKLGSSDIYDVKTYKRVYTTN